MDKLIIRQMEERDIQKVVEIERLSFSTPWSPEAFLKELNENKFAVYLAAEYEGEVAGYIGMWKIVDEGHITNIAVSPNYRGKGIGDRLLSRIIEIAKAKEIAAMTLEVRVSNKSAQYLYEKHGFVSEGIRLKYYENNNENANIMWLRF